ncbi:hypothetical protein ACS0TY_001738 [Phlomoides rotata]
MGRKPLSDITNKYNLIPTSALRKFVAASSSSNSFPKPPFYNSSSTNLKVFSDSSSKSNTSVGSSNVSATLNSKKTVQFRTPSPVIRSITPPGGIGSKDAAHNRRQITEKSKKEREANVIVSHTPVEKRKEKGKAIAVPLSSSPSEKTKYNHNGSEGILKHSRSSNLIIKETGQEFLNSSSFSVHRGKDSGEPLNTVNSHEKTREKGKAIAVPLSSSPSEKTKDNQNGNEGILKHSRSSNLIIKETGQGFLNPSSFSVQRGKDSGKPLNTVNSHERTREKGKAIAVPLSSSPSERTKENQNGNEGIFKHSRSSNLIIKGTGEEFLNSSSFLVPRAKDSGKPLNTVNSHEKTREKGKAILQPSDRVEIAEHKGPSTVVAVKSRSPTRKCEKRKFDAVASSCPPMMRPKSIENNLNEARDVKSLKSCTDPHLKLRKGVGIDEILEEKTGEVAAEFVEMEEEDDDQSSCEVEEREE